MEKKDNSIIYSLDKGLFLLETIEQAAQPISLQELWQTLKWDKSTIYRLLVTLEKRGYIHRDPKERKYSLGMKIYALYDSLIRKLDVQQITKSHLALLARRTGQTAHLAVAVGSCIVFIDRAVGSEILSVNTQIGAMEPLHCTALGKGVPRVRRAGEAGGAARGTVGEVHAADHREQAGAAEGDGRHPRQGVRGG